VIPSAPDAKTHEQISQHGEKKRFVSQFSAELMPKRIYFEDGKNDPPNLLAHEAH
jgi:hypothetical protein